LIAGSDATPVAAIPGLSLIGTLTGASSILSGGALLGLEFNNLVNGPSDQTNISLPPIPFATASRQCP
jgi:hypothetical protein